MKRKQNLKTEEWNNFLGVLQNSDIWKANRCIKPRENQQVMSQLKKDVGKMTMILVEKREYLWTQLLPPKIRSASQPFEVTYDARWPILTEYEIESAITALPNRKASDPDCITGV
jgi:hypothetical protein